MPSSGRTRLSAPAPARCPPVERPGELFGQVGGQHRAALQEPVLLVRAQGPPQRQARIRLATEGADAGMGAGLGAGRLGAEEHRCQHELGPDEHTVHIDVVAHQLPAPRVAARGLTEDGRGP